MLSPSTQAPDTSALRSGHRGSPLPTGLFLLLTFIGFLSFYGLNAGEFYRTEGLRAIIAAEFLRSGNWIVPTLYGEPFFTKPPGMYAAIALASWPAGGVCEWSARVPSAIAAIGTVLLVFWYFGRQLGRRGGFVAAALLPLSFLWLDKATAAEMDMLQTFWVTASILFFLRALEGEESGMSEPRPQGSGSADAAPVRPRLSIFSARNRNEPSRSQGAIVWWLLSAAAMAGGVLTKWTAPAFVYGTAIPLLCWRRQLRFLWCRGHLLGVTVAVAICSTWLGAAVALSGWDVLYETVKREALVHLSPGHHHRPYPWGETLVHPFRVWAASLPVSLFALPALWPGFARSWDSRGRRLLQALHCWAWPNLLFWSLVPEHAVRQTFPLFPAIAGLAAMVWLAFLEGSLRWPLRHLSPVKTFSGTLVAWLIVKLVFVHVVVPGREHGRDPRKKGEQIAAAVPDGKVLYLFRLKDEGIMFYYARAVRRLTGPERLPSSREPAYCILDEAEWRAAQAEGLSEKLLALTDEQGAPVFLVRRPPR
jgi:4-amino-4-deoxy-L-arabinose transferase-like glycosyltransferase